MIRIAIPADIPSISAIYNEAILEGGLTGHLEPLSTKNRRAWYLKHRGRYSVVVKIVGCSVVGYAAISPYREGRGAFDETCEISYYVSARFRGRGFGMELIERAIEQARRARFHLVIAAVLGCNARSMDLLIGLGFAILARFPKVARINSSYFDHVYLSRGLR
jgi:L-amino acid N-acyltransferase